MWSYGHTSDHKCRLRMPPTFRLQSHVPSHLHHSSSAPLMPSMAPPALTWRPPTTTTTTAPAATASTHLE